MIVSHSFPVWVQSLIMQPKSIHYDGFYSQGPLFIIVLLPLIWSSSSSSFVFHWSLLNRFCRAKRNLDVTELPYLLSPDHGQVFAFSNGCRKLSANSLISYLTFFGSMSSQNSFLKLDYQDPCFTCIQIAGKGSLQIVLSKHLSGEMFMFQCQNGLANSAFAQENY